MTLPVPMIYNYPLTTIEIEQPRWNWPIRTGTVLAPTIMLTAGLTMVTIGALASIFGIHWFSTPRGFLQREAFSGDHWIRIHTTHQNSQWSGMIMN